MEWWQWLGLGLNVVGLLTALWGVDELSGDLFPNRPLPHRAAGRWLRRKWPWHKPGTTVLGIPSASVTVSVGTARLTTHESRPDDDAPATDWYAYFDSRLDAVNERFVHVKEDIKEVRSDLGDKIQDEKRERAETVRELREETRTWVGGEQGRGLTVTFWGLAMTLVGTILQGIG